MIIDLTLNPVKLPGLENYTPPFGTKKSTNVGLTTLEGCNNITLPWEHQRPVVISENSTFSADIERNGLLEIEAADITLTMVDAVFTGCEVKIMTTFSTGTATLLHKSVSITLQPGFAYTFMFDGLNWINSSPMAKAYPVGSYYLSENDVNPVLLFGFGTWARVAGNGTIWGTSDDNQSGQTKAAGLPEIFGGLGWIGRTTNDKSKDSANGAFRNGGNGTGLVGASGSALTNIDFLASRSNAIYGASTTVQPPARTVNIWKRTA